MAYYTTYVTDQRYSGMNHQEIISMISDHYSQALCLCEGEGGFNKSISPDFGDIVNEYIGISLSLQISPEWSWEANERKKLLAIELMKIAKKASIEDPMMENRKVRLTETVHMDGYNGIWFDLRTHEGEQEKWFYLRRQEFICLSKHKLLEKLRMSSKPRECEEFIKILDNIENSCSNLSKKPQDIEAIHRLVPKLQTEIRNFFVRLDS